jgi:hypothetical protein
VGRLPTTTLDETHVESQPIAILPEYVDIPPSPRILQVLGDIEFEEWQCIAEFADNSFDEFLDIRSSDLDWSEFIVTVVLPTRENPDSLEVRDTGRGMALASLTDAVCAGWTGNEPFDRLGLFGMGFNIASARLGQRTRVVSKRSGESDWVGVDIDLKEIIERREFRAKTITLPADDPSEHGTRVIVDKLKPDFREWFQRNGQKLWTKIGRCLLRSAESPGPRCDFGMTSCATDERS